MKKILFLLLLLVSCTKDEPSVYCWYCESFSGQNLIMKSEVDNLNENEIIHYQRGVEDGIRNFIKSEVTTICKKKEGI